MSIDYTHNLEGCLANNQAHWFIVSYSQIKYSYRLSCRLQTPKFCTLDSIRESIWDSWNLLFWTLLRRPKRYWKTSSAPQALPGPHCSHRWVPLRESYHNHGSYREIQNAYVFRWFKLKITIELTFAASRCCHTLNSAHKRARSRRW